MSEVQPPELAALVDFAERPRAGGWSLRSALTRYAQPEPVRVGAVLDLTRRIETAMHPHQRLLDREGPAVWAALEHGGRAPDDDLVALLGVVARLDALGDVLATWAADPSGSRPDAEVDVAIHDVAARLAAIGVPQQERPARPPRRSGPSSSSS